MHPSARSRERQRQSRLPAQVEKEGKRLVEDTWRFFHPVLGQLDEYGAAIVRTMEPMPEPYLWTMMHPEFGEALESERSADTLLLAGTKMGRELALAARGRLPGGWNENEMRVFWLCEARYPYRAQASSLGASMPPERLSRFRAELRRRRNNAGKRSGRAAPKGINSDTGEIELVDPLRADVPPVPALLIRFWTYRPLWLADSASIAAFLDRMIAHIRSLGPGWVFRKEFPPRVQVEHVNAAIYRYGLHRYRGRGKVHLKGNRFVPDEWLAKKVKEIEARSEEGDPTGQDTLDAPSDDAVERAVEDEIRYIQTLPLGG